MRSCVDVLLTLIMRGRRCAQIPHVSPHRNWGGVWLTWRAPGAAEAETWGALRMMAEGAAERDAKVIWVIIKTVRWSAGGNKVVAGVGTSGRSL